MLEWEEQMEKDGYPDIGYPEMMECPCPRCEGEGYYWAPNGPDDCDKEICDCENGNSLMDSLEHEPVTVKVKEDLNGNSTKGISKQKHAWEKLSRNRAKRWRGALLRLLGVEKK
jgi:hypothetical protein